MTKPKKPHRDARFILIIGTNGTGKSTLSRKLINAMPDPALVITPDAAEWRDLPETFLEKPSDFSIKANTRHVFNYTSTMDMVDAYAGEQTILFDDCRAYFDPTTKKELGTVFIRRRQRMIDIIAVGHGFTEVPPRFFTFCTELFLFRTTDNPHKRRDTIRAGMFDNVIEAVERVNKKASIPGNEHYFELIKQ